MTAVLRLWSRLLAIGLSSLTLISASVAAPSWTMWLENPTHTPTAQFRPTGPLTVVWRFKCGGVFGSPAVSGDAVYFGSRDGYLYALDEATGARRWRTTLCIPGMEEEEELFVPGEHIFQETGVIATPAVDADRVYVGGLDGVFYACERATGKVVWAKTIGGRLTSSPLLTGDAVIVGSRSGKLVAMAVRDGTQMWSDDAEVPINSSPAMADGKVIVGAGESVVAVDALTGRLVWRYHPTRGAKFDSSPCLAGRSVYIAAWDGTVVALRLSTGELIWERQIGRVPIFATPAVDAERVYAVTTKGMLVALDRNTGAVLWHTEVPGERWIASAGTYASPVICGPVLIVCTNHGRMCVLDPQTGDKIATFSSGLLTYVHGTPTICDGAIYVSSEDESYGHTSGQVVKLACGGAPTTVPDAPVRNRDFPRLAALALGLMGVEQPPLKYGGWELVTATEDPIMRQNWQAVEFWQEQGVVADYYRWSDGLLTRNQLAAFYHKLFWEPNPYKVRLPPFRQPDLADRDDLAFWVRETAPRVVGLGLIQAVNGEFRGGALVTAEELRASLARAKELLGPITP